MINRYSLPEMADLFSDQARLSKWLDVELAVVQALAKFGKFDSNKVSALLASRPTIDDAFIKRVEEREMITDHDLAAFVDVVQSTIGTSEAQWIHYGLTSSDVVDTALGLTLKESGSLLIQTINEFFEALKIRAVEFQDTPMVGRTHGMHAEPTTFGAKLALFALQVKRDAVRLDRAVKGVSVGKLSGAVGTYSNIDPEIEKLACDLLGLEPVPATQVISRDRHAEYLYALASIGSTIEMVATEIRHMARTELGEANEAFKSGQKGSSAMPHKRNPILSERLCGLARVLRGYLLSGLEDIALWHERDISHSSVERIILPDASILAHYMLKKATSLITNLDVHPEKMLANLELSNGVVFSQSVLLALVDSGLERDSAYRIVQSSSKEALSGNRSLKEVIEANEEVGRILGEKEIENAFNLSRILRHANRTVKTLEEL
ncbi:MAG: adenylosuccinate lyase [Acidimicrobiales bacterium]|nr:adenylosuccinate lyase [Acidimicrobiales bacterium]